ncbi:MAG: PDZ domain-containing protein [Acidobacteriota bacterium]|nr:PDZ domain-containing protein [Blastocatellia bacterium]MDW8413583.1 PDZ domain-containing protein [Acidobacteriota bacterium]
MRHLVTILLAIAIIVQAQAEERPKASSHNDYAWLVTVVHQVNMRAICRSLNEAGVRFKTTPKIRPINLTTGIVIDPKHVITRLVNLAPESGSEGIGQIEIRSVSGKRHNAKFVGIDGPTGLSLLFVDDLAQRPIGISDLSNLRSSSPAKYINLLLKVPLGMTADTETGEAEGKVFVQTAHVSNTQGETYIEVQLDNTEKFLLNFSTGVVLDSEDRLLGLPVELNGTVIKSISAYEVRHAVDRILAKGGNVPRGWLGIVGQDTGMLTAAEQDHYAVDKDGILVKHVIEGSPAQTFGVKEGDIITAIDGKPVTKLAELSTYISSLPAGKPVELLLRRAAKDESITVVLGERGYNTMLPDKIQLHAKRWYLEEEIQRINRLLESYRLKLEQLITTSASGDAIHKLEEHISSLLERRSDLLRKQRSLKYPRKPFIVPLEKGIRINETGTYLEVFSQELRPEDVLIWIDDHRIVNQQQLRQIVESLYKQGRLTAKIKIRRNGQIIPLTVNLKEKQVD